jgi:MOSC domain-containing protein YiiM
MAAMKIISLNVSVSLPSTQRYEGQEVFTGRAKKPVPRAMLRSHNFDGNGQADLLNHGGLEKAGCVYPFDYYVYWERVLDLEFEPSACSENLTVSSALKTVVCVGDVFGIGETVAQVCQARQPCNKLAGKYAEKLLPEWVVRTGYTGFYMRVLSEGLVNTAAAFERIEGHPDCITITEVNDAIYERFCFLTLIERLATLPEFSAAGRGLFTERLERLREKQQTEAV